MKRRVIIVTIGLALLVSAYFVGHINGCSDRYAYSMHYWEQLAELDKSFLKSIVARPNRLATGAYILETHFPGLPHRTDELHLTFSNGRLFHPDSAEPHRDGMSDTFQVDGNVVSWQNEGILFMANADFVGIIDGDMAWGRVYGWNSGNESIGIWRLYPKAAQKKE